MRADVVLRWAVLTFGTAHFAGLVLGEPVPWSATLTVFALSACVLLAAPVARGLTVATLSLAGLVASVDARGGGLGWPFAFDEAAALEWQSWLEGVLLVAAAAGFTSALPFLRGPGWRSRISTAATLLGAVLVTTLAATPLWDSGHFDRPTVATTVDRTGLLVAVVPVLVAVFAAMLVVRRGLRRLWLPALTVALLAAGAASERPDDLQFGPGYGGGPFISLDGTPQSSHPEETRESINAYLEAHSSAVVGSAESVALTSTRYVEVVEPQSPPGWTDGSWWSAPVDWDNLFDPLLAAAVLLALLTLVTALQGPRPPFTRLT